MIGNNMSESTVHVHGAIYAIYISLIPMLQGAGTHCTAVHTFQVNAQPAAADPALLQRLEVPLFSSRPRDVNVLLNC